jgi:hypothetical protein
MYHTTLHSHSRRFDKHHNIWRRMQTLKPSSMHLSPTSCYFLHFMFSTLCSLSFSVCVLLSKWERKSHTLRKQQTRLYFYIL